MVLASIGEQWMQLHVQCLLAVHSGTSDRFAASRVDTYYTAN